MKEEKESSVITGGHTVETAHRSLLAVQVLVDLVERIVGRCGALLEGESPSEQLLVWLVRGAMRFYATGNRLPPKPQAVREAERGYYAENDLLGQVIEEHCEVGAGLQAEASAFNCLARAKGCGHGVKAAMEKRGFSLRKVSMGGKSTKAYTGVSLRE